MQIQELDQTVSGGVAPATHRPHRRTALLVAGALALVLGTIGTVTAMAGRSSPAARSNAPSIAEANPTGLPAAEQPAAVAAARSNSSAPASPVLADGTYPT